MAFTLDHIARNRALMKSVMSDSGMETLIVVMSEVLERIAGATPPIASAIAGAYMSVLLHWLDGTDPRTADDIARFMRDVGRALATRPDR